MWNWSLMRLLTTLFFVYWIPLRRKLENCSLRFTFIITVENLREILQIIEFLENNHVARFLSLKINIVWGYSDPENRCQVTGKGGPVSSSFGMPEGVFDIPILSKMTPMFIDQKDFFKQVFIFVSITWF